MTVLLTVIFNQGWGGFLEEEVLVEAEEVRPAVWGLEGLVKGTHCQHPHPEEDSLLPRLQGTARTLPAGEEGRVS